MWTQQTIVKLPITDVIFTSNLKKLSDSLGRLSPHNSHLNERVNSAQPDNAGRRLCGHNRRSTVIVIAKKGRSTTGTSCYARTQNKMWTTLRRLHTTYLRLHPQSLPNAVNLFLSFQKLNKIAITQMSMARRLSDGSKITFCPNNVDFTFSPGDGRI
jgi:hypothetical protein